MRKVLKRLSLWERVTEEEVKTSAQGAGRGFFEQVACGARHSCALNKSGRLYTWGCNLHDQCGASSDAGTTLPRPMPVRSLDGLRVTHVAAGLSHTIVCTDAGAVYTWGWNRDGQLGHGANQPACRTPRLVESQMLADAHVMKVSSGSRHCAALTEDGKAYTWGWNAFGQLGTGDKVSRSDPVHVAHMPSEVKDMECGWWHTVFIV
ncbi:hypothetical protein WJX75_006427 [Coccomyxa subellipsoidea]|uniref:RCC1-like domain-containing protein n=1 Tax=Coccomyxa subellipsoidea TaxID=248742 RepID=A0ABR2YN65_9CHLO